MDALISAAARALAAGDPLAALQRVALRDDAAALALRGIAMAQLGDFVRAKELLRRAGRGFGPTEATARARCVLAEAEIALVSRDLSGVRQKLGTARATLQAHGDRTNAAHAGYLDARWLLLIGHLDACERILATLDIGALPLASRAGYWLVAAGIEMRRLRAEPARAALDRAGRAARETGIVALAAEVAHASRNLDAPVARLSSRDGQRLIGLAEVAALIASDALIVDAARHAVREGNESCFARRPSGTVRARTRAGRGVTGRRSARHAHCACLSGERRGRIAPRRGCASKSGGFARPWCRWPD